MIHPYQLHPLSKLYREETLREARSRNLVHRAKVHREPREKEKVRQRSSRRSEGQAVASRWARRRLRPPCS